MKRFEILEKALEKAIEMEWIKPNPHIRLTAVAQSIESDLCKAENEQEKQNEISQMIDLMLKHFPDKVETFFDKKV